MKLAAQAEFYIQKFGVEAGIKCLKSIGYQSIIYTLTPWCLNKFPDDYFLSIQKELAKEEFTIPFVIFNQEIYVDNAPNQYETRKKMCLMAVKATALMGCKILGVHPVSFRHSTPDVWEKTKRLTYELYSEIKEEADKLGVKLAFLNNTKHLCFSSGTYSYGCRAQELIELANEFESGVIIDPVFALKSGERVEELLVETKEKLVGFCITDMAQREMTKALPMFGGVDYHGLIRFFEKYESDAIAVMMYTPIMNRYSDFITNQVLMEEISKVYFKMGCLISNCKIGSEGQ